MYQINITTSLYMTVQHFSLPILIPLQHRNKCTCIYGEGGYIPALLNKSVLEHAICLENAL